MSYEDILVEPQGDGVVLIRLNRPSAMNALRAKLMQELGAAVREADDDADIGCIILAGNEKAFAAGADIKEMQSKEFHEVYNTDFITREWEELDKIRTPIIAAVKGYALGGGCEIAMMCDFILAADTAKFGQPEITIGTIPGAGGTQRLTRFVGKSKAMEMCLTGRMMNAEEAERSGLVSRVVDADELEPEAIKTAKKIASLSLPALMMAKESVKTAYETTLSEGVRFERRVFHSSFALDDRKEGMAAFAEKRAAKWQNR